MTPSNPFPAYITPDRSMLRAAFPRVETILQEYMERRKIPGLAYGLVVDGELIFAGGMGIQNPATQTPVTPDSIFRIASMSKSFTAMALVRLRDEGKLRLDAPAADYVPELAALTYPTRDSASITVRHLLTMSAGFPEDNPWGDRHLALPNRQLSEWLLGGIPFSTAPGMAFEYSNYSYGILGRIVANVAGEPYSAYVTRNVLLPLGMTSSTFDVHAVPPERLALGQRLEDGAWVAETPLEDGAFGPMGGLFTTINDFARYMAYLLDAFPPRDDAEDDVLVIRRSSRREMQQGGRQRQISSARPTPDQPAVVLSESYGFGLVATIDSQFGYSVSHGGGLPGYGTFYRLLPDSGIGLAVFANLTYAGAAIPIANAYLELSKTGGLQPRRLSPAPVLLDMQQTITDLYNEWHDEPISAIAADSFFLDLPLAKRREQFQKLRAALGKCQSVTPFEPENALRGRWTLRCRGGSIDAWLSLAPTMPPRLQALELTAARRLSPALKAAAAALVALIGQWDDAAARPLLARSLKREPLRAQFAALRVQYGGALRLGETLESDGATFARVRLLGKLGSTDMKLTLDAKSGKVGEVTFTRPRETLFVP